MIVYIKTIVFKQVVMSTVDELENTILSLKENVRFHVWFMQMLLNGPDYFVYRGKVVYKDANFVSTHLSLLRMYTLTCLY